VPAAELNAEGDAGQDQGDTAQTQDEAGMDLGIYLIVNLV
jgi:hypothetical protein